MSLLPSGFFAIVFSVPQEADLLMDVQLAAEFLLITIMLQKKLIVHLLLQEIRLKILRYFYRLNI